MDITVTLGQALASGSVLLGAGGIVFQVRSLAGRVASLEKKITNGISTKLAVTANSNAELRGEVDEMWKVINFHKKTEALAGMEATQQEFRRRIDTLEGK